MDSASPVTTDGRGAFVGLAAAILTVTLLGGGVHTPILILASVLLCAAAIAAWRSLVVTRFAWVLLGLCGVTLLQLMPLPIGVLGTLAPNTAYVWSSTGSVLDESAGWVPVSLAPGASLIEALKIASYALVTALAATIAMHRGPWGIFKVIVAAGVAAALTTLVLRIFDIQTLLGIYRPRFAERPLPIMNPNSLSGFLNLATFSSFALLLRERRRERILVYAGAAAFCIGSALLLASRGATGSLVLGLLLAGVLVVRDLDRATDSTGSTGSPHAGASRVVRGLMVGATVFAGLVLFALGARLETWRDLSSTSLFKLQLFSRTLTLIGDNLWLGVGRGAFETAFAPYQPGGLYTPNIVFTHPENIVLQWVSEWGLGVFTLALIGLILSLQRRLLRSEYRPATRLVLIGVGVVLFQNLFDLGSEIPALMIGMCAAVGALWSTEEATRLPGVQLRQVLGRRGRELVVGGCLLLAGTIAVVRPLRAVEARESLYVMRDSIGRSAGERSEFQARLSAALHQYPADVYLLMMGAHAWRGADSAHALRFANLALERAPNHGPAHLFVAEELWSRGAQRQAMLELRLALESWPMLLNEVTQRLASWTRDPELTQQAAPEGEMGVALLANLERIKRGDDAGTGK